MQKKKKHKQQQNKTMSGLCRIYRIKYYLVMMFYIYKQNIIYNNIDIQTNVIMFHIIKIFHTHVKFAIYTYIKDMTSVSIFIYYIPTLKLGHPSEIRTRTHT